MLFYYLFKLSQKTLGYNSCEQKLVKLGLTIFQPPHDETNKMACSLSTHWAHSDDPDQTAQADLSLRWAQSHFVGFVMWWLISYSNELEIYY